MALESRLNGFDTSVAKVRYFYSWTLTLDKGKNWVAKNRLNPSAFQNFSLLSHLPLKHSDTVVSGFTWQHNYLYSVTRSGSTRSQRNVCWPDGGGDGGRDHLERLGGCISLQPFLPRCRGRGLLRQILLGAACCCNKGGVGGAEFGVGWGQGPLGWHRRTQGFLFQVEKYFWHLPISKIF